MDGVDFEPWPKIARLNRDITITEKLDGTNAAIAIASTPTPRLMRGINQATEVLDEFFGDGMDAVLFAQSRKRIITPEDDNYGFARWVRDNAEALAQALGHGRHFGEWWGSGVQRGYGLRKGEKRFSLFNTARYSNAPLGMADGLGVVPTLYQGPFAQPAVLNALDRLATDGSVAAPGFMDPEGVVVFHSAAQTMFKVTLHGDAAPKSMAS